MHAGTPKPGFLEFDPDKKESTITCVAALYFYLDFLTKKEKKS